MLKNILIASMFILLGASAAYFYVISKRPETNNPDASMTSVCTKHEVHESACPWCDPSLVDKKGMCVSHDIPEALCWKCNPALITGYIAINDWCAGHSVPESRCDLCKAGNFPPGEKHPLKNSKGSGGQ